MKKYHLQLLLVFSIMLATLFFLGERIHNGFPVFFLDERSLLCPDCNVVLVSIDTLRADHLGVYGYFRNTSPGIDEFSMESIVFENAYAPSSWTLPSHMSIFTSLYPSRHNMFSNYRSLNDSTLTLADVLYNTGYKTAAFTGGGYVSNSFNYHTFEVFDDSGTNFDSMLYWLENNSNERFFLFWHTYRTHFPFAPSMRYDVFSDPDYFGIVNTRPGEGDFCANMGDLTLSCNKKGRLYYDILLNDLNEMDLEYIKAEYDGEILEVDHEFSRLMDFLRDKGVLDNTIVVFTSDHGESFAERENRKKIGHGIMYDEVLHVPLMIRVPGLGRQVRIKNLVEGVDIMPTVLSILGLGQPDGLDGKSLLPLLVNRENEDYIYDETGFSESRGSHAIRFRNLKLIYSSNNGNESFELYDLEKDPFERDNIFGLNKSIDVDMMALLFSKIHDETISSGDAVLDNRTIERLQELGYIS